MKMKIIAMIGKGLLWAFKHQDDIDELVTTLKGDKDKPQQPKEEPK